MRLNDREELNTWVTIWNTALNVKVSPNVCSVLFFFFVFHLPHTSLTIAGYCLKCELLANEA